MAEGRAMVAFAGCTTDEDARAFTRQVLHDQLIDACPERLSEVRWYHFDPSCAEEQLRIAGLADHPGTAGLLTFLAETPDSELVVGMVEVPSIPEGEEPPDCGAEPGVGDPTADSLDAEDCDC